MIDKRALVEDYKAGYTQRKLRIKYKTSFGTINKILKEFGVAIRQGSKFYFNTGLTKAHRQTKETRLKLSKIAKENGLGGNRQAKKIEFEGQKLDSSYEYRVAVVLQKHGIKWIKTTVRFKWLDAKGGEHSYNPDLYLPDYDVYLDPKNDYCIKRDTDKIKRVIEQNKIKVFIVDKEQIKKLETFGIQNAPFI